VKARILKEKMKSIKKKLTPMMSVLNKMIQERKMNEVVQTLMDKII